MKNSSAIAFLTLVALLIAGRPSTATQAETADYDTFMVRNVPERLEMFGRLSPESKASIVRTHMKRWIAENRSRLTDEQLAITNEWLKITTAENYREPVEKTPDRLEHLQSLERRTAMLFSREEMRDALTIEGRYIPKR